MRFMKSASFLSCRLIAVILYYIIFWVSSNVQFMHEERYQIAKIFLVHYRRMWYTGIAVCGYDEIGRHARFRFSCSNALGFESPYPYQKGGQMAAFCFSPCKETGHYEKRRVFAKKCGSFFREMVYYFFINILSCLCAVRADLIGRAQYGIPHGT